MLTFYCPQCWNIISKDQRICPACGFDLKDFNTSDYDEKLIAALSHSVLERKIMAAEILGNRGCQRALPEFLMIITSDESNYFFLRAVLLATAKINHPDREIVLQRATKHPSQLVAQLANELLDEIAHGHIRDDWDHNPG